MTPETPHAAAILIAEDSAPMRNFLCAALEDRLDDVEVVVAESGFAALRLLPSRSFQLLITDINMPDINGLELIHYLRENEHYRHIPILIVSTEASEEDRKRGLALGADAYLNKPFDPEALESVVAPLLGRKEKS
jgi:two-component system chemotaxis response regulator CheY